MYMYINLVIPYSGKLSWVQTFAKMLPDAPEETYDFYFRTRPVWYPIEWRHVHQH